MTTLIYILLLVIVLSFAAGAILAAPWVPTRRREREQLLEQLGFRVGEKVYDLGCGDGSVLFAVARRHPEAQAVGYELALLPLAMGWLRKLVGGRRYRNVRLRFGDFFKRDLSDADTVFVFLLDKCYPRLIEKFGHELQDDCRVIVMAWPLPGIEPVRQYKEPNTLSMFIYEGRQFH